MAIFNSYVKLPKGILGYVLRISHDLCRNGLGPREPLQ